MGKKVKKGFKKAVKNPFVQTIGAGLIGGPIFGSIVGGGNLFGGFGGDEQQRQTSETRLSEPGQQQFDFAGGQLQDIFGAPPATVQAPDFGQAIGAINSIDFGGINNSIGALEGFSGTQAAKDALGQLGAFRGTPEAFRTLRALEDFGRAEQGFVTDARNAVLNFDEGFESDAIPLLLETAQGKFLTEQSGNPFIRDFIDAAQRPVIENFREEVLPGILSTFAGTGGVGSSLRAGFTNQQARDLQRNLGDISANISFNVFEAERQRQQAAQNSILGFEDASLNRQLQARTINLEAAQQSAQLLLAARTAAGSQATALSQQRLQALQGAASGQVALSAQRQAALAAALQGRIGAGNLRIGQGNAFINIENSRQRSREFNAGQQNQRVRDLIDFQRNSAIAGNRTFETFLKPGFP